MRDPLPPVTKALLVAIVAAFVAQLFMGPVLTAKFALWPLGGHAVMSHERDLLEVGFEPWQVITYSFLHGGFPHLALNGFALYMFGAAIEQAIGSRPFALYWFVSVLGAAAIQLAVLGHVEPGSEHFVPTVGASGGIYGLLLAYAMFWPQRKLMLLFPPIPMPAWLFVIVFAGLELYLGVSQSRSPIAHFAHLGGMVGGLLMILYWRGKLPVKPRKRLML